MVGGTGRRRRIMLGAPEETFETPAYPAAALPPQVAMPCLRRKP